MPKLQNHMIVVDFPARVWNLGAFIICKSWVIQGSKSDALQKHSFYVAITMLLPPNSIAFTKRHFPPLTGGTFLWLWATYWNVLE